MKINVVNLKNTKIYVSQRKQCKTVGNGITDYKTKFYLTKIVKSFVQPCNIRN